MPRALKITLVWLVEFAVLFMVAETAAVFFLPPGLTYYYPQKLMQPSATRIYEPVPNQRAFTIDKPFVTNSMGFRDEREIPVDKDGELRILSLGDSIAEGLGVAAQDTYARRLEMSLKHQYGKVRVINAGVGGYTTWQVVDRLKDKGFRVQPDIVILEVFPGNDLWVRPRAVAPLSPLGIKQQNDARITILRQLKRSRVLYLLRERLEIAWNKVFPTFEWTHQQMILDGRTSPYLERAWGDFADSLGEFATLVRDHHVTPILVVFPLPAQVRNPATPTHVQQRIDAIARHFGLPVIDLLPILRQAYAARHDIYIPWDNVHLTPRGHQVVAAASERYLIGHALVGSGR